MRRSTTFRSCDVTDTAGHSKKTEPLFPETSRLEGNREETKQILKLKENRVLWSSPSAFYIVGSIWVTVVSERIGHKLPWVGFYGPFGIN